MRGKALRLPPSAFRHPTDFSLPTPASASHACRSLWWQRPHVPTIPGPSEYRSPLPTSVSRKNDAACDKWPAWTVSPAQPPPSSPVAPPIRLHGGGVPHPCEDPSIGAPPERPIASPIHGPRSGICEPAHEADTLGQTLRPDPAHAAA